MNIMKRFGRKKRKKKPFEESEKGEESSKLKNWRDGFFNMGCFNLYASKK